MEARGIPSNKNRQSYLRASQEPPRNGAPILDLNDLFDDIKVELDVQVYEECKKKNIEDLYYMGITTSTGYRLMLHRVYQPHPNSIEMMAIRNYPISWREPFLKSVEQFRDIDKFLNEHYPEGYENHIAPLKENIFRCFFLCPFEEVKVVIFGQDPYTTEYEDEPIATGLAFSINPKVPLKNLKAAGSLKNILQQVKVDYPDFRYDPDNGDLSPWTKQGVLLPNASLTTERGSNINANSHKGRWKNFMYNILTHIVNTKKFCIFVAWGAEAKKVISSVEPGSSFPVLYSGHPSPLATGANIPFAGNGHFKKINELLLASGRTEIDWNLL